LVFKDWLIRENINKRFVNAGISTIYIEKPLRNIIIVRIATCKPGIIIGRGGVEIEKLRQELKYVVKDVDDIQIYIKEIRRPEIDASIIAENLGYLILNRVNYRRAVNEVMEEAMRAGAKGIKVALSGRLGGAELARTEKFVMGRVPLSTLRADIDYAVKSVLTKLGLIGIKVWVFKGMALEKRNLFLEFYSKEERART